MTGEHTRRTVAAFRLGAALSLALGAIAGGYAIARGPDMNLPMFFNSAASLGSGFSAAAPASVRVAPVVRSRARSEDDSDEETPVRTSHSKLRSAHSGARTVAHGFAGTPVCVRLCDGLHFPAVEPNGGDASCAAQCPDAPVALYAMPGDDIDAAVSLTGAKYVDLPVAGRHATTYNNTCTCHMDLSYARTEELKKDRTLRKGDVLATSTGFLIVEASRSDGALSFAALEQSRTIAKDARENLLVMQKASHLAAETDALAPVARKKRGEVFVSDGDGKDSF